MAQTILVFGHNSLILKKKKNETQSGYGLM